MKTKIIDKNVMSYVYEQNGWLYWKILCSSACRQKIGNLAGSLDKSNGYYIVRINNELYFNHRILYQFYHNVILESTDVVDHIDRNPQNNSKENLRLDPNSQNAMNRKTPKNNKTTGLKNIHITKSGIYEYYRIQIRKNGKCAYSKIFPITTSREDLIKIRDEQLKIHHGEFASFG